MDTDNGQLGSKLLEQEQSLMDGDQSCSQKKEGGE